MDQFERRFWPKVEKSNGHWMWRAGRYGKVNPLTGRRTYGVFSVSFPDGTWRSRPAHVVSWELVNGPVPEGLQLDHLCDEPLCVRPEHLRPSTGAENTGRSTRNSQALNRAKTHCKQGHPFSGDNLYVYKDGHRACRICIRAWDRARKERRRRERQSLMPGRGSGIGLSAIGGLGSGDVGGSATSTRSGTDRIYGQARVNARFGEVHHYLWVLVLVEILALVYLRHAFRRYHGG